MMQLPDSHNPSPVSRPPCSRTVAAGDTCPVADLLLLDNRQWLYVQNRYNLTPREREIAEMICQGLRSCNIARNLRIKTGTVKTHTRNIYRKVRVKSKIAMLLRFVSDTRELSVS